MCCICSRTSSSNRGIWSVLLLLTIIGCGALLYASYIYRGNVETTAKNPEKIGDVICSEKLTQENCPSICTSKECVFAANFLLENMDDSIDPCQDFYLFSCNKLIQKFSKQDNYSAINGMELRLRATLKDILDKLKGSPESKTEKLKIVYDSCMNDDSSELNDVAVVKKFLNQIGIRKWPNLTPTFEFDESSLERTLGRLNAFNEFAFFKFIPLDAELQENKSANSLLTLQVITGLSIWSADYDVELYQKIFHKVLSYFGVNHQNANLIWEDFRKIDAAVSKLFQDSISNVIRDPDDENLPPLDHQYLNCDSEVDSNKISVCETLRHFIEYTQTGNFISKDYIQVPKFASGFIENIFLLLNNYTRSEVANYLALRFIVSHLDLMNVNFRSILLKYPDAIALGWDNKVSVNKGEHCLEWIIYFMPHTLAQEYVAREFSNSQIEELNTIVQVYLKEAENYVSEQNWIDERGKSHLRQAIRNTKNKLEYFVNILLNGTTLNSYMDYFTPTNESFFVNAMEYRKGGWMFYFVNKDDLPEEVSSEYFNVNAYHFRSELDIRVGMVLPPIYRHGLPKLLNLATMGTTIGHELGHEIEVFLGNSKNGDLSKEVRRVFSDKLKCLEEQYSKYEIKAIGKKVNGSLTKNENAADIIAIELTQRVIDKYAQVDNNYPDFALPGLNFTSRQLSYISLTQMWCNVRSKELEQKHFEEDAHATPNIRINGMLQNLPEYSSVFNCPPGSRMNPLHKCPIRD